MAQTTTTSMADHLYAAAIEAEIRERMLPAFILPMLFRDKSMLGARSKSWQSNKWGAIVAQGVDEDTPLVPQAATLVDVTGTVGEVGAALEPTDLTIETTGIDLDEFAEQGEIAVREKIEKDCAALFSGVTEEKGDAATPFSTDLFNDAITELRANKVPGPYVAVVHPYQWGDIRNQIAGKEGSSAAFFATGKIDPTLQEVPGLAGNHLGVTVFEHPFVPAVLDQEDEPIGFKGCMFSLKRAFELAFLRLIRVAAQRDELARSTIFAATSVYGVLERDPDMAVALVSKDPIAA